MIKTNRLFNASCIGLVVTAFTFAIRANLLGVLAVDFSLSLTEVGQVASAAFWGFTLTMFIGGPLCDTLGIGRLYLFAFIGHIVGSILTIAATGYWSLFFSTLLVGLGNGFIESASYAMVGSMYTTEKAKKINQWHIWFPAGIVVGGLLAYAMHLANMPWRWQISVMILPTLWYGIMFFGLQFPKSERITMGVSTTIVYFYGILYVFNCRYRTMHKPMDSRTVGNGWRTLHTITRFYQWNYDHWKS